jgi:hypothetical protein
MGTGELYEASLRFLGRQKALDGRQSMNNSLLRRRGLSEPFLDCLKFGFLSELTECVRSDPDLNLEIREAYINLYFKGLALLKLSQTRSMLQYRAEIHEKFTNNLLIPPYFTEGTTHQFVTNIPFIKENISKVGQRSFELEYEQMIIRANNFEPRNNTEYFIVDRQYSVEVGRFDLTGFYWEMKNRQKYQEVPICLMEVKFALYNDIQHIHSQLERYYEWIQENAAAFAEDIECVFKQKMLLGLYNQEAGRLNAMNTLTFSKDIKKFRFILAFVDYNRNSKLLQQSLDKIQKLHFAEQIKIFYSGFGMWQHNVEPILTMNN